jgi:hypothetical protein
MIRPNDRLIGFDKSEQKSHAPGIFVLSVGQVLGEKERWGSLREESRDLRLSHHILTPFLPLSDAYSQLVRDATEKSQALLMRWLERRVLVTPLLQQTNQHDGQAEKGTVARADGRPPASEAFPIHTPPHEADGAAPLSSFPSGGKEDARNPPVSSSKQSSGVLRAHSSRSGKSVGFSRLLTEAVE